MSNGFFACLFLGSHYLVNHSRCPEQDPNKLDNKVLTNFDHVKGDLKLDDEGSHASRCRISRLCFVIS